MRLLLDQCEGRAPLSPFGDMKLPCAGRDLMDGALGALDISNGDDTETCMRWLRNPAAGSPQSFGGQPWPAIWYTYGHRFNATDKAWLFEQMNKTAGATVTNLTNSSSRAAAGNPGTDVSYNNMYYMNMVNVALLGEIVGNKDAADMGYRLIDDWLQYDQTADLHEFTSPTYYWVQINSLYMGYLYTRRPGAKEVFKAILDHSERTQATRCCVYEDP